MLFDAVPATFAKLADRMTKTRVCFWGTYDTGKPRVRLLLDGLRKCGAEVGEIHANAWSGISDKSQVRNPWVIIRVSLTILLSYPLLLVRHALTKRNDVVVCGYPGNLDILLLWPLAKLRGEKLALDAFLPVYDTIVMDRSILSPHGLLAWCIHAVECISCRCADFVIVDTAAHGEYFAEEFGLEPDRIIRAFVGYEPEIFNRRPASSDLNVSSSPTVLFYGQFIPLHGLPTILEAAKLSIGSGIRWKIIGTGQEAQRFATALVKTPIQNLEWIEWVEYNRLCEEIHNADICLGIFGTSDKAARVIPNKVFQIIACGKNLITRDSTAIRELFPKGAAGVHLVEAGNPQAILNAIKQSIGDPLAVEYDPEVMDSIRSSHIGQKLIECFSAELVN